MIEIEQSSVSAAPPGFIERFLARAESSRDAIAIEVDGEPTQLTYAELLARMERLRGALLVLGVREGDPVLVMLASGPDLVASFFAIASLSAIAVPVSESLTSFELAPVLADARPRGAIVRGATGAKALATCASIRFVLTTEEPGAPGIGRRVELLDTLMAPRSALVAPAPDAIVSCHFTYKGLGYPLGVLHRYSSYSYCLDGLMSLYADTGGGRAHLCVLPLYPVYALLACVITPLALGARLVIARGLERGRVGDLLVRHRPRVACLVPLLYTQLVHLPPSEPLARDMELVSGGSHLDAELVERVVDTLGLEPRQGYGLTETLPVTASSPRASRAGTLGVPIHDAIRVEVVDAFGRPVPAGRVGEIVIGGPTVMAGYLGRPRETDRFLRNGAMRTGDLGDFDADGFLRFEGRALRIAKCASQMVDLREIEQVVHRHPDIAEARATVSVDPDTGAERTAVAVVTRPGAALTSGDVIAHVRAHLSRHKVPRVVRILERSALATAEGA